MILENKVNGSQPHCLKTKIISHFHIHPTFYMFFKIESIMFLYLHTFEALF